MRAAFVAAVVAVAGCAELGMPAEGKSCSVGTVSRGILADGKRLPDSGEGFATREVWRARGIRYGTDEMIDLIIGTGRRLAMTAGQRMVVADLSAAKGGKIRQWHKAHQTGRDVDLVYFMRDATGARMEGDAMREFDAEGAARDGSGITVDFERTWEMVRALLTADEATVQWVFMYQPFADKLIAHATAIGETPELIARATLVMKQPNDSAKHDDHIHVRIYCAERDLDAGCRDLGPMEPMLERLAARGRGETFSNLVAQLVRGATHSAVAGVLGPSQAVTASTGSSTMPMTGATLGATLFLRWP